MAFKLTHPDTKTEIQVQKDHLESYLSQGWQTKPNAVVTEDDDK